MADGRDRGAKWTSAFARARAAVEAALGALSGAPTPLPTPAVQFSDHGVERASRPVRALLGEAAERGAPYERLRDALGGKDQDLSAALDALLARGERFRRRVALGGGIWELVGAPAGAACVVAFTDVTSEARAADAATTERRRTESELEALRSLLDRASVPVWRTDATGAVTWCNEPARRAGATPPADDTAPRVALPDGGGALQCGTPQAGAPGDSVLRRFIETVTETFAHLRIGLAIYDGERRLTLANPAVAEIFGMSPDWLAGRPTLRQTLDQLREARQLPEQLNYPAWRATLFTLFDDVSRAYYDERWELPDGRSIHVVGRPHPLGGIAFIFEDITEAIAAQRWRLTAVEVRRVMLDALGDGVVAFGPDGRTRMTNSAFMQLWRLGETVEEAPRHVADFSARCDAMVLEPRIWEVIREAVSGGVATGPRRWRVRLTDGRVLSARIAQMPDGATLAAFSDITDSEQVADALRERAETLEAAEQMRTAMLYQISHRLRTPLNDVIGFAELLAGGRAGPVPEPQARYVATIRDACTRLLEGVESLTGLVGEGAPSLEAGAAEVSLELALRGAVELLERRMEETGVSLEIDASAEAATAHGDPPRVRQLVYAALAEAVEGAPSGARLRVSARSLDGGIELRVACGRRVEAAEGSPSFALARRNAEMNDATLAFEHGGPQGSTIVCRMPGAAGRDAGAAPPPVPPSAPPREAGARG